jgi:hypothetical protein
MSTEINTCRKGDLFDPLSQLSFNAPILTRRQGADRLKQQHVAFFKFSVQELTFPNIARSLKSRTNSAAQTSPQRRQAISMAALCSSNNKHK